MGLFSKKKGGSFFGNLLATVANKATGGLLGAKRVAALKSGDLASINSDAKVTGKMLKEVQTTFAGEAATLDPNTQTYAINKPLNEVEIRTNVNPNGNVVDGLLKTIGDKLSYLGARTSENTSFGVDKNVLIVVGALGLGFLLVQATKNN